MIIRILQIVMAVVILPTFIHSQVLDLPFDSEFYTPLKQNKDPLLNAEILKEFMANKKTRKLIKQKKLSIGLVDLSTPSKPRFAEINGDHMMYAASLPKIAVLLAVMQALDEGSITMSDELHELMSKMITVSDNNCTTELIDRVGFDKIASVLQDDRYNLYDEDNGGGLWVGKRYGKGGARKPDPIKGISHAASATQVCRFYYMLAYGNLINCERSIEMLEYLKDPKLHHKFVNVLDQVCPDADIYRKSGTWRTFHSDSVLVVGDEWRSYILVALVDDPDGSKIVKEVITKIDAIIKPKT
ncbi:MAG: serine hydrolase [Saprospiraceae bacterium]|nr:serine hydrolase [Saprospiraceae bacterium]